MTEPRLLHIPGPGLEDRRLLAVRRTRQPGSDDTVGQQGHTAEGDHQARAAFPARAGSGRVRRLLGAAHRERWPFSTGEAIMRFRARPTAPDSLRRRALDGDVATVTAELSARIPPGTDVSGAFPGAVPPLLATVAYLIFATGLRGVHGACVLIDRGSSGFLGVRDGDIRTFRASARESRSRRRSKVLGKASRCPRRTGLIRNWLSGWPTSRPNCTMPTS